MAFDLTIGTERAQALQNSIQDELMKRGYSPDADPVMAEYITIMLINNKTAEQITAELEDLIGASEYDVGFTEWLFNEAAKKSEPQPQELAPVPIPSVQSQRDSPPRTSFDASRRPLPGPRQGAIPIYNQALNQALPSGSQSGQKRSLSARSPSPNNSQLPNKSRRMDLPTGPRAMHHDGGGGRRSLLERMGGRRGGGHGRDEIQARIDAVTNQQSDAMQQQMNNAFNNGMGGMMMPGGDMAAAAAAMGGSMVNPLALQEMMVNQMALMAHMASNMGIIGSQGQFMGPNGFPMMNGMNGMNGMGADGQNTGQQGGMRRGGAPPGRGRGRGGAGSSQWVAPHLAETNNTPAPTASMSPPTTAQTLTPAAVVAPAPKPASTAPVVTATPPAPAPATRPGFTPPERPQSPSLCKFGLKCTNALCRYSHPSPVATPESGVVLSNDPCEAGKDCKNKDCIKAHVSPAARNVQHVTPVHKPEPAITSPPKIACRYGAGCLRISSGCPFTHPKSAHGANGNNHFNQQCRFGAGCTRAACPFQHPEGRVLPSTFHRGLSPNTPAVTVATPGTGTMGAPSPHRTVIFNKPVASAKKAAEAEKKVEKADAAGVEATIAPSESKVLEATA